MRIRLYAGCCLKNLDSLKLTVPDSGHRIGAQNQMKPGMLAVLKIGGLDCS